MGGAWAFPRKNDIVRTSRSVHVTEKLVSTFGNNISAAVAVRYAEITELIEGETKIAKGFALIWDEDTNDFIEDEDGAIYDNDILEEGGSGVTVQNTNNITSPSDLSAGQIVRLEFYPGLSETSQWLVLETGGGAEATLIDVIEYDEDTGVYTGNILDNPTDRNSTVEGVNIKTLDGTSNFQALNGHAMFAPQSYTEEIPEDEQEEPEEGEEPVTTRLVYYVNPPVLFDS